MTTEDKGAFEAGWRLRFERFGRTYDDEALISGWSDAGLRRRVSLFSSLLPGLHLPDGAQVLDLGCGGGTYVRLLGGLGHRVCGLDYSVPSLVRAVAADPGRKGGYLAGEAYALPFADGRFDLVVSIGVLQALGEPHRALVEMARVTRPGGAVVVEGLNARSAPTLVHRALDRAMGRPPRVRTYPRAAVRAWLRAAGLAVTAEAGLGLPPRRYPGLARVLDARLAVRVVQAVPGLLDLVAHSFLFAARKPGGADGGGR